MKSLSEGIQDSRLCYPLGGKTLIAAEMQKSTSHRNAPVLTALMEDAPIEVLQVVYDAHKEGLKTSLINLVREVIADRIERGKMY